MKGRNENVTNPKSVLKIGFKIDPIEIQRKSSDF
jgi:hypothetical protein